MDQRRMTALQRARLFCVGLASGFFVGCFSLATRSDDSPSRLALGLLMPLSAAAAYALYFCGRAWYARGSARSLVRRALGLLWVLVALTALSLWPGCVMPHVEPLGTWCAVSSLVGAVAAWQDTPPASGDGQTAHRDGDDARL